MLNESHRRLCTELLKKELIPALGCTEPIAVAYAAARCRALLGFFPEHMDVSCSGNIIKNVKGVIVPTMGDMRGIDTAAILGALAGREELRMQVLQDVREADVAQVRALRATGLCSMHALTDDENLHIIVEMTGKGHRALVEISGGHTNIICEERDGERLAGQAVPNAAAAYQELHVLTLEDIYDYAKKTPLEELRALLSEQLEMNLAIAQEGIENGYGAQIGRTLLQTMPQEDIRVRAVACSRLSSTPEAATRA